MTAKNVLSIAALKFSYPNSAKLEQKAILDDISLSISEGQIVSILGASGCGKTTLLNLIAGLLTPVSGTISLAHSVEQSRTIGYIFQQDALFPWQTVRNNLMLAAQIDRTRATNAYTERITQYLRAFHLEPDVLDRFPAELSGGMRQRVSIIQSLLFNPELMLLDEPFSALDFYTKLRLETEFYQLVKEQQKAAILVTHDIDEAIAMSHRVFVMSKNGRLVREFEIGIGGEERLPESARGTPEFAALYAEIWQELRAVI